MVKKKMKREKSNKKKKSFTSGVDFDIKWGIKGLKFSFIVLLLLIVILFIIAFMSSGDITELNKQVFKTPVGPDYLGIFAGIILFIAVPFLIGIKIGIGSKNKV
ncbi:hypothetical protein GOV12_04280 [Candidatus Pacearchaeota archaeon]|nr:hypothetical protein [Candidatus Pacearchaeota archaeon]